MGVIIRDLKIQDVAYLVSDCEDNEYQSLRNLSKINIFVGENNSGKSRLLRSFILKKLEFIPNNSDFNKINNNIEKLKSSFNSFFQKADFDETSMELKSILEDINKTDFLVEDGNYIDLILELERRIEKHANNSEIIGEINVNVGAGITSFYDTTYSNVSSELIGIMNNTFELNKEIKDLTLNYNFKKTYIPILRGLRSFQANDIYFIRTSKDYFGNIDFNELISKYELEIFTGLSSYKKVKDHLLGNLKQRKLIEDYQKYLSEQFFDNRPIALIPKENNDEVLTIKIGDEKERPIYELGDGIQSIIILTLPLFLREEKIEENENILVFIEEPEHLLHPGLQRKLIDTFKDERFENFQFFITTHSNHFLDITLDYSNVSIFSLKKKLDGEGDEKTAEFLIDNVSYGTTDTLEMLGVRNSSVFLSNCTIWIEGVTDRYYIKKYFDIYQEYLKNKLDDYLRENPESSINFIEFREDYHYSYVEYAGNNITHWSFLDDESELNEDAKINVERLCGKVCLIADRDNLEVKDGEEKPKKVERFEKLKDNLKDRFYSLDCKEVENTLSKNTISGVVNEYEKYFKADDAILGQIDEFLQNADINEENYKNDNLGEFIENEILKNNHKRKTYIDGNTIKDKTNFCKKALNYINDYEDLSNEAKIICDLLYQFISFENNHDRSDYIQICEEIGINFELINFEEEIQESENLNPENK